MSEKKDKGVSSFMSDGRLPVLKHHRQVDRIRAEELTRNEDKRTFEKKTEQLPILVTKPIIVPKWLGKKYTIDQLHANKEFYSDTLSPLRSMKRRSLSPSPRGMPGRFSPTPHGGVHDSSNSAFIPKSYIYQYVYYCHQIGMPVPDWMKNVAEKMGFKGYTIACNPTTNQRYNVI